MDSDPSGKLFDSYYYAHNCGAPYARSEAWLNFFDRIAARLIEDFQPRTVLDAGCAWGFLVERLRARGVEAWGVDLSEFAIGQVHESVKPYCFVGSIAEPLPQTYDMIVSIEVLEHMPPEVSVQAIENLCLHSSNLIISSSPQDYKEATHLNVQPPDYWVREFARHGFYHDVDYEAGYITLWAARYYKPEFPAFPPIVQAYERKMWQVKSQINDLRVSVLEYHKRLQESQQQVAELKQALSQREGDAARLHECEARWADLQKGRGWRLLQQGQKLRVALFPPGSTRERWLDRLVKR